MIEFLVIGAGKAGTTALYYFLDQHPQLFLSPEKEPRYFMLPGLDLDTTDEQRAGFLRSFPTAVAGREAYLRLFRHARPGQLRGEASIQYLTSETAAANIGRHAPEAKLICVLRDPVERAFSNFGHGVRDGAEAHASILDVLDRHGPRHFYFDGGYYAEQLERYDRLAPHNPLRVWLYDEFQTAPERVVGEMYEFLGVDSGIDLDTSIRANVSGVAAPGNRWARIYDGIRTGRVRRNPLVRRLVSLRARRSLVGFLSVRADRDRVRARMTAAEWERVHALFSDDVRRLEQRLGRDLSRWRQPPGQRSEPS